MSSPSRLRLPCLFLPVVAGLALSACSQEKAEAPQVVRPVKVIEIAKADNIRELHYAGAVRARASALSRLLCPSGSPTWRRTCCSRWRRATRCSASPPCSHR